MAITNRNTYILKLATIGDTKIGRPWVSEALRVWTPDAEPNSTCRFINPLRTAPEDFHLPIGRVCFMHEPYRNSRGEVSYLRYHVLVTENGPIQVPQDEANEHIRRYQEPITNHMEFDSEEDITWEKFGKKKS